ncbi:WD40 repeat domain-containing protein [Actinoplanes derwentensis]|uniref:WD40 repeat n=1 Tax=Actinoplanes derwentensis TaxID=113562 RepID=A0A1H1X6C7_9ACTN|nr:hypothetical protein [Actinoplanes derwentensis]GID85707.1 hypothetical protein Ade03nite_46310 [Actinoplanes derwentensis]SDT04640.1 WD40 repeat [Actinoplanes derwentensis]
MTQAWEQDAIFAPHRVLRTPLGFDEKHTFDDVGPAALVTVAGRPALAAFGLPTDAGSYYCVVDLETGERVPDRAALHGSAGPRAAAAGMCGDRAVLALLLKTPAEGDDCFRTLRLRDAWSGEPLDVEFPRFRLDSPIAVATIDGRGVVAVGPTVCDAGDGSVIVQRDGLGWIKALVEYQGRLLHLCYDVRLRLHTLRDALTGDTVGEPFTGRDSGEVATVVVGGHLWVVFPYGRQASGALTAWDVTAGCEVSLSALWDVDLVGDRRIEDLRLSAQGDEITALVQWGYQGRNGTEVWSPGPGGRRLRGVDLGKSSALALAVLDGRTTAVTGYDNRALTVFDATSGVLVPSPYYAGPIQPEIQKRKCSFADVGGRGALLVCGGTTGVVWDFESGLPVRTAPFGAGVQTIAAGVLDGRAVFAVLTGRSDTVPTALRVWDPQISRTVFYREIPAESDRFHKWPGPVVFVEFAGRPTVARRFNRTIEFYDARTGELAGAVSAENLKMANVLAAGRIGDRTLLAAGDSSGTVQVWDASTGHEAGPVLRGHRIGDGLPKDTSEWVSAIAFVQVAGRDTVVTGGDDMTVRLWDLATGEAIGTPFAAHTGKITALLPTGAGDETAVISVAATGAPRMWMLGAPPLDTGHTAWITALAAGVRDGRAAFASSSHDGTIRLWEAATGRITGTITVGPVRVTGVAFGGPGRDILIGVTADGLVQRWDANSGTALGVPLHRGDGEMYAVGTVTVDGRSLAGAAGADRTLRIWDVVTGEQVSELPVGRTVTALSMAATGDRLLAYVHGSAVGDERHQADSVAVLWDVFAREPVTEPVYLSDGGEVAVLGLMNGRPVVLHGRDANEEDHEWDVTTMDDLVLLDALTDDVIAALDQHDHGRNGATALVTVAGRTLVVAGFEKGAAILDERMREVGDHYREHRTSMVNNVAAIEADGGLVVASSDHANAVRIWRPSR